jgi:hypothetical protein
MVIGLFTRKEVGYFSWPFFLSRTSLNKDVNMARTQNPLAPALAERLAQVARDLRIRIYGPEAYPEWGTKFDEIEQQGMEIGLEVARLFMEQSVASQAQATIPEEAFAEQDGEIPKPTGAGFATKLETPAGDIDWQQPRTRLKKARRDFFPSGQSAGD